MKRNFEELVELEDGEDFIGVLEAEYPSRAVIESSFDGEKLGFNDSAEVSFLRQVPLAPPGLTAPA